MNPLGRSDYGWTGLGIDTLSSRLITAGEKVAALKETLKFDAVAFCGSSGAAIGFHLAIRHKIPLIYVRKEDEQCHGTKVECNMPSGQDVRKYLIVDDFIDSGKTVTYIIDKIAEMAKVYNAFQSVPVGVFCYDPWQTSKERKFGRHTLKIHTV